MSTLQIPSSSMNNRNLFCKQTNNNNNMFSSTSSSLSSVFFSNKKQIITRAILVADQKTTTTSKLLDFQVTNPMKLVPDIQVSNELEVEIEEILRRLDAVMEKLVEVEMEKYKRKARKGDDKDLTMEEEEMCREVVRKFLEKPIDYLTSNVGNGTCLRSKQKIKDLWCLVNLLENSYTR